MRLISGENASCSAKSESWVSYTKASERARARPGTKRALKLFPHCLPRCAQRGKSFWKLFGAGFTACSKP